MSQKKKVTYRSAWENEKTKTWDMVIAVYAWYLEGSTPRIKIVPPLCGLTHMLTLKPHLPCLSSLPSPIDMTTLTMHRA